MKDRRMKGLAVSLIFLYVLLLYRLADIQLLSPKDFGPEGVNLLSESVQQRTQHIPLHNGRGEFVDRNHESITHPKINDIVFFPFVKKLAYPIDQIASLLGISSYEVQNWIEQSKEPFFLSDKLDENISNFQFGTLKKLKFPGIIAVERTLQGDPLSAQQFVGYVRENPNEFKQKYGVSGLEKSFDPFLQSKDEEKLLYHVDGIGEPLFGLNVKYVGHPSPFYPVKIETTIDLPLQKEAEQLIDEYQIEKGGLVLLDVTTRDVLAMVSKPDVNPKDPLVPNQMLVASTPGSIFKIIIAAAAIQHPNVNIRRVFNCDVNMYNDGEPKRQLGMLSFEESFAQSCNRTFAELGQEMIAQDPNVIENYARKLGLTDRVGWKGNVFHFQDFKQFPSEEKPTIWGDETHKNGMKSIAQTSIGQLNVKVTPLAVANMMATIATGGVKKEVRGVSKILYQNNTTMTNFDIHVNVEDRISSYNAYRLRELLYKVVNDNKGTGQALQGLEVAGKSGTAEIEDGIDPHRWFAGFFPYDNPRYAMVVVSLNAERSAPTYDVFRNMVEYIYNYEQISY